MVGLRKTRGAALITALLLCTLMLVLGLGFLGQRSAQYEASMEQIRYLQARMIADAGLRDALTKMAKDIDFPPTTALDQTVFAYSEDVVDGSGDLIGSYRVEVNVEHGFFPYDVARIISTGYFGDQASPTARVTKTAELDLAAYNRTNPESPNPNPFRIYRVVSEQR